MTRETAQKHREAFNAFCDGKTIQYRKPGCQNFGEWETNYSPVWNPEYEYRIKPREPREWKGKAHSLGTGNSIFEGPTLEDGEIIRVREILPDETP